MKRFLAGVVLSAVMFASGANAAVTYSFSSVQTFDVPVDPNDPDGAQTSITVNRSFTLTNAGFITDGEFAWDTCTIDAAFNTCAPTMTFDATPNTFDVQGDYIGFNNLFDDGNSTGGGTAFYFFQPGAFSTFGTYTTAGWPINDPNCCYGNAGEGTLTVSGTTGGVPEPATWGLMILGFGAAGAALRRRRSRETFATV